MYVPFKFIGIPLVPLTVPLSDSSEVYGHKSFPQQQHFSALIKSLIYLWTPEQPKKKVEFCESEHMSEIQLLRWLTQDCDMMLSRTKPSTINHFQSWKKTPTIFFCKISANCFCVMQSTFMYSATTKGRHIFKIWVHRWPPKRETKPSVHTLFRWKVATEAVQQF